MPRTAAMPNIPKCTATPPTFSPTNHPPVPPITSSLHEVPTNRIQVASAISLARSVQVLAAVIADSKAYSILRKSTAWGKDEWCKSASQGQANGQAQMKDYSQRCPNARLILLGYSQGGAVAQDILGGGGGKVFECEQPDSPALDSTTTPGSQGLFSRLHIRCLYIDRLF